MAPNDWIHVDPSGASQPANISPAHFTLHTPPKTDIWRPSPTQDDFNAPHIYTRVSAGSFRRLSVTVSADWKTLYDQGGLLLLWPGSTADTPRHQRRWLKTGIEVVDGKPALSVVGCDRYSDWSLCPLPLAGATHATVEAVKDGTTLWVYFIFNGERRPLREVKWAFLDDRDGDAELLAGVYAAKPTPEADNDTIGINVIFRDLTLETA